MAETTDSDLYYYSRIFATATRRFLIIPWANSLLDHGNGPAALSHGDFSVSISGKTKPLLDRKISRPGLGHPMASGNLFYDRGRTILLIKPQRCECLLPALGLYFPVSPNDGNVLITSPSAVGRLSRTPHFAKCGE